MRKKFYKFIFLAQILLNRFFIKSDIQRHAEKELTENYFLPNVSDLAQRVPEGIGQKVNLIQNTDFLMSAIFLDLGLRREFI